MWQTSQFSTHFFVKSDGFFDKKYHFTSQNFNFVLKNTPDSVDDFKADPADENETVASGATLTYTVLMGGDTVSKTTVGTITYTYTKDVVYYTVIFKDAAGNTLSSTQYEENTAVEIPADQTKAEDETYTYTFEGWKVEGAEDSTAVKTGITATGNLTYVPVFSATEKEVGGGEEDEYTLGDVFVDEEVNDVDIMLLQYYYAELFDDIDTVFGEGHKFWEDETDPRNKAADVFTDGEINDVDIMLLQYYYAELFDDIDAVFGEGHKFWE